MHSVFYERRIQSASPILTTGIYSNCDFSTNEHKPSDYLTRSSSTPPRPAGNSWSSRLWDNLYAVKQQEKKSLLRVDVQTALSNGATLSKVTKNVSMLLGLLDKYTEVEMKSQEDDSFSETTISIVESESYNLVQYPSKRGSTTSRISRGSNKGARNLRSIYTGVSSLFIRSNKSKATVSNEANNHLILKINKPIKKMLKHYTNRYCEAA